MGIPGRKVFGHKHRKRCGFRKRMKTAGGRAIIRRRRRIGRRLPSAKRRPAGPDLAGRGGPSATAAPRPFPGPEPHLGPNAIVLVLKGDIAPGPGPHSLPG